MASLAETFVTKSYDKKGNKKMPGMKKKSGDYERTWRPVMPGPEGPKKSMPRKKAAGSATSKSRTSRPKRGN